MLQPNADRPEDAEIAVSPTSRAGAVYILEPGRRATPRTHERVRTKLREMDGVDLVAWLARLRRHPGRPRRRRPRPRGGSDLRRWSRATGTSSASARAASCATSAERGGWPRASPRRSTPTSPAAGSRRGVPRRPLAAVVRADLAARRRRADLGRPTATSASTGAGSATPAAAATARSPARTRSRRCCSSAAARATRRSASGRCATSRRSILEHFGAGKKRWLG